MVHRAILITGVTGSGKTTMSEELQRRGYDTVDMDAAFCRMRYKETKEWVEGEFQNHDLSWVQRVEWMCNQDALQEMIEREPGTTFFCGSADNLDEILPLFDQVFLLQIDEETMRRRLTHRSNNNWAQTEEVQNWELTKKEEYERRLVEKGAAVIDAMRPIEEVADEILSQVTT